MDALAWVVFFVAAPPLLIGAGLVWFLVALYNHSRRPFVVRDWRDEP